MELRFKNMHSLKRGDDEKFMDLTAEKEAIAGKLAQGKTAKEEMQARINNEEQNLYVSSRWARECSGPRSWSPSRAQTQQILGLGEVRLILVHKVCQRNFDFNENT